MKFAFVELLSSTVDSMYTSVVIICYLRHKIQKIVNRFFWDYGLRL